MEKTVLLMCGLPGTGKSTKARNFKIQQSDLKIEIYSADDYFMIDGEYMFDKSKLHQAHKTCQEKFLNALNDEETDVIIIDNTNLTKKERKFYIEETKKRPQTEIYCQFTSKMSYFSDKSRIEELIELSFNRNVHKVPRETIETMIKKFEMPTKEEGFDFVGVI